MQSLRRALVGRPRIARWVAFAYWTLRPLTRVFSPSVAVQYASYVRDLIAYRLMPGAEKLALLELRPSLGDRGHYTPVDGTYFVQDAWAARKALSARPGLHVDVGSSAAVVGILAQALPVVSLDIRPVPYGVPGLERVAGDVTRLPISDRSLGSVSSLCVIEHVGLGRYGDSLDPEGSVKAAGELARVLIPGGSLYVSVPVGRPGVHFNAHRCFGVEQVLEMFSGLVLQESAFVQGGRIVQRGAAEASGPAEPLPVGLFHFTRP